MGESLTQRHRVGEEGPRVVNSFREGKSPHSCFRKKAWGVMVPQEEATANSVPAAAVRQRWQALFGFTGLKGRVGVLISQMWKP